MTGDVLADLDRREWYLAGIVLMQGAVATAVVEDMQRRCNGRMAQALVRGLCQALVGTRIVAQHVVTAKRCCMVSIPSFGNDVGSFRVLPEMIFPLRITVKSFDKYTVSRWDATR